jgi:hypothetical protein
MVAAASGLSACAGKTPPPAIEVHTVVQKIPVPVACVDKTKIPDEPPKIASQLTGEARHDLDITGASAVRLRQALHETFALLAPCTKP